MAIDPKRVKEIFLEAAEQPDEAALAAYLDRACGGDAEVRDRVEALLRSHNPAGSFLGTPAAVIPDPAPSGTIAFDSSAPGNGAENPNPDDESDGLEFLSPSTRPDSLGRLGHYEMLQVLGRGGFGIVLRAFDDMLQRVVAVKVMAPQIATLSPARKRFLREARSSAQVRHENVVQIYEVGEQPLPHLVMEFIPGETLQQKLDRSGPLEVLEVLRIGGQIAEGLAAAHSTDLIHRDIKPGNVLLEGGSHKAKITDFGLARAADDASISQSGIIAGTPMFMAPEQALGNKIDQRADLFSLGSVLYQMTSGRPPFRAPSALAVLKRVVEETPRPIPEIIPETPDWLCGIIAKLHAKKPDDRFQSAREVADLLADCEAKLKAKQKVKNVLPDAVKPDAPTASGGRKWAVAAAVLSLALVALFVTMFASEMRQQVTLDPVKPGGEPKPILVAKTDEPDAEGWIQLFNGKDLTGWTSTMKSWTVEKGILASISSPKTSGLISVRDDFANFHLRVETRINDGGNSGIYFRFPSGKTWKPDVLKAQINCTAHDPIRTGSLWHLGIEAAVKDMLHKPDEWATLEVIAVENDITIKVNGKVTTRWVDENRTYRTGRFGVQLSENTVVQFRKIEIKNLSPLTPPLAVAPFDAAQARVHQEAWANHLGVDVEITNSIGMKLRLIPPGVFLKGSTKEEVDALVASATSPWSKATFLAELPQRDVVLKQPFYLGIHEVTVGQFRQFVNESKYITTAEASAQGGEAWDVKERKKVMGREIVWHNPQYALSDQPQHPVVLVSLADAEAFCAWLSKKEGQRYTVPLEDQWEYACRAGTTTRWWCGDSFGVLHKRELVKGDDTLHSVGALKSNPFGLFDMHGNVAEVCRGGSGEGISRGARDFLAFTRSAHRVPMGGNEDVWYRRGFRVAIVDDLKPTTPRPKPIPAAKGSTPLHSPSPPR